jgi:hypothetical protein
MPPKRKTEPADPGRIKLARALYIFEDCFDFHTLSKRVELSPQTLRAACRHGEWEIDRLRVSRDPRTLEERQKRQEKMAECRVSVEEGCATLAVIRIDAQTVVAKALCVQAAQAETPRDVRDVARALGPAPADVTAARLSVGLTTEKVDTADSIDKYAGALAAFLDAVEPETSENDPSRTATPSSSGVARVDPASPLPTDR